MYQSTEHSPPSLNGLGGHGSLAFNHGDELGRDALAPRSVHSVRAAIPTSAEVWERRGQSDRNSDPSRVSTMPRLRGKSRRGAAWYRAESRRKRIRNFERALALASTRRKRRPWMPPMAIVEEISLEEAMQSHPSIARRGKQATARRRPVEPQRRQHGGPLPTLHCGGGNPSRRHHRDGGASRTSDPSSGGLQHTSFRRQRRVGTTFLL
jgi:hypothetical protein